MRKSDRLLGRSYIKAAHKGYSVIEIARVAGLKSAKFVYACLVRNGVFQSAQPGKLSRKIVQPDGLEDHLKIRELTFAQWCSNWLTPPAEVAAELSKPSVPSYSMDALKRDFPTYYCKLTGAAHVDFVSGPEFEQHTFNVDLGWNGLEGYYTAAITGSDIVGYGDSYVSALHIANILRKNKIQSQRLETLDCLPGYLLEESS